MGDGSSKLVRDMLARCERRAQERTRKKLLVELLAELDWHLFRGKRPKHFDQGGPHCPVTREILQLKTGDRFADRTITAKLTAYEWARLLDCSSHDVPQKLGKRAIKCISKRGWKPRKARS
jgi:hypothetical protein